uniref:Lipase_3 domain-containing protein n=1 Tax=Panagrellus redivivus TaxID=6233 RepID=A0A7E4VZZ2_PANRE
MIGVILFVCVYIYSPNSVNSYVMTNYNDSVVRRVVYPLTSASYGTTPELCLKDIFADGQLVRQYTVLCDRTQKHTCSGYLAYSTSAQAIFLVFRGSSSTEQVNEEFLETVTTFPISFPLGGRVNPYFFKALQIILTSGLEQDLIYITKLLPGFSLWVSGHSLGAGLASLAAGHIAYKGYVPPSQITLITFGQPRTGNYVFAKTIDKVIPNTWRVTHRKDLVPVIVPLYAHHNREVWYNNSMAPGQPFVICGTDDDQECVMSGSGHNWDDHSNYFNVDSYFAVNGCKNIPH